MSQLRVLIRRVENAYGDTTPYVASIAEYMKNYNDWDSSEREKAMEILHKHGVSLVNSNSLESIMAKHYGPTHLWRVACIRCGKIMNGDKPMVRGMHSGCSKVVGNGPIKDIAKLPERLIGSPKKASAELFIQWKRNRDSKEE